MTEAKEKAFPPRVFLTGPFDTVWTRGAQYVYAYQERKYESDIEFISKPEVDALLAQERADATAEAYEHASQFPQPQSIGQFREWLRGAAVSARGEGNAGK